jgi:hypothetical protein
MNNPELTKWNPKVNDVTLALHNISYYDIYETKNLAS